MENSDIMLPEVASYLANQKVLVTGVTGFVGLALVEKLLRTVPDISTIYVLIRAKRGKSMEDRLNEIKENAIFETLINKEKASALSKLVALEGNIDADQIGLSEQDLQTVISNVNYVFHCAATLDFEASLKTTVEINLLGTRRIVELCKKIQNLKVLVHVSSAYTNANRQSAEEILYPPPEDVNKVVELVRTLSSTHLEEVTPSLLKNHPNTYTFTKALAEHEVANSFESFPSCIIRPSMIVGAWKEPVPGWTNSKNGPQGFIMGAAMGVVRRLPVGKHLVYDYIPVDVVVNTMILAAVFTASQKNQLTETPIFQCTSSTYKPFRWANVEHLVSDLLHKYPLMQAVWYPHLKLLPSITHFRVSAFIFHMIPAYIFDTISRVSGVRPKLVRLHTAVNQSLDRLEPFIFQEWMFDNSKSLRLHQSLAPADKEVYGLDVASLQWEPFFEDMAKGVRRYLHKEKDSTLDRARNKDNMLMVANLVLQVALFALFWFIIKCVFGVSAGQAAMVLPFLYVLFSIL
uniref:Fatty acyl-CoA reductase n=1 Tax=Cuerna arida TaxID=1464854 RepID=A0A1B6GGU4_9HEMI